MVGKNSQGTQVLAKFDDFSNKNYLFLNIKYQKKACSDFVSFHFGNSHKDPNYSHKYSKVAGNYTQGTQVLATCKV